MSVDNPDDHPAAGPSRGPGAERTVAALERENEALRRRVRELERDARRFRAIFDGGALSVQIFDKHGRSKDVNQAYEAQWQISREAVEDYCILDDKQLEEDGLMPQIRKVFDGEAAARLPIIRYDPTKIGIQAKTVWAAAIFHPVKDEAGELQEAVLLHYDIGEIKQREEDLERAVAERTQDIEDKLRLIEEQQRAILELSTPVIRLWDGILALPLVGVIDSARAAQVMENLLGAIVAQRAGQVIIDITGVAMVDSDVAAHLMRTVEASRLLGARCILVGISPAMAQTLVQMDVDFGGVTTAATLEEGLREAFSRMNRRVLVTKA